MTGKASPIANIFLDWDARDPNGTFSAPVQGQGQWEDAVINTLSCLSVVPPCQTSTAVLNALSATGKTVTIVPFTLKSYETGLGQIKPKLNAAAVADDIQASTVRGKLPDELPDSVIQQVSATPSGPERERMLKSIEGTGRGSNSKLYFTAQDWAQASSTAGLDAVDETLLHELVHSLRQAKGQEDPDHLRAPFAVLRGGEKSDVASEQTSLSQIYDTLEEFAAITITNIYRSENGRQGLRRHHLVDAQMKDQPLSPLLTNPRMFLSVWRRQLEKLQQDLPLLCDQIAPVQCAFNPLFELYAAKNRFAPGTRRVISKAWADAR